MPSSATKTGCPDAEVLHRYVADQLSEADTAAIEEHLEHCGVCEQTVERLEKDGPGAFTAPGAMSASNVSPSQESLLGLLADPNRIEKISLPEFSVPKRIDKYEILEVLGSGGMGTVLRAKHVHLKREVAIKLVKGVRRFDSRAISRFMQEIEAIGKLDHGNIVRAHDAGIDEKIGQPYLVMELLQGRDVETLVKLRGPLSPTDACKLIRQAAMGLDQIHRAGLVHRDVKPSNLFVTKSGIVKLLDLGLVRLYDEPEPQITDLSTDDGTIDETGDGRTTGVLTSKLAVLGSPLFMAPEQIEQSHRVDHRADIYSLGCTFYHLLTGQAPYGGTRPEVLAAHLKGEFPCVRNLCSDVPVTLHRLIGLMTMRNVRHRLSTAREVIDVLTKLREAEKPKPPIVPPASGGW